MFLLRVPREVTYQTYRRLRVEDGADERNCTMDMKRDRFHASVTGFTGGNA